MLNSVTIIYVVLGLVGGCGHWAKKRYWDNTTEQNIIEYFKGDIKNTKKAISAIVGAEIALSFSTGIVGINTLMDIISAIGVNGFVTALTVGYTADSALNTASDATLIANAKLVGDLIASKPSIETKEAISEVINQPIAKISEAVKNDENKDINNLLSNYKS